LEARLEQQKRQIQDLLNKAKVFRIMAITAQSIGATASFFSFGIAAAIAAATANSFNAIAACFAKEAASLTYESNNTTHQLTSTQSDLVKFTSEQTAKQSTLDQNINTLSELNSEKTTCETAINLNKTNLASQKLAREDLLAQIMDTDKDLNVVTTKQIIAKKSLAELNQALDVEKQGLEQNATMLLQQTSSLDQINAAKTNNDANIADLERQETVNQTNWNQQQQNEFQLAENLNTCRNTIFKLERELANLQRDFSHNEQTVGVRKVTLEKIKVLNIKKNQEIENLRQLKAQNRN